MGAGRANLSYEPQEPSFLRKLRAQQNSGDNDRHERPLARPKRVNLEKDDDDDAPTYVDGDTARTLSKEEVDALTSGRSGSDTAATDAHGQRGEQEPKTDDPVSERSNRTSAQEQPSRSGQDVTEAGVNPRKRKAVKVVSDEPVSKGQSPARQPASGDRKKKAKPVKLSFGLDEH